MTSSVFSLIPPVELLLKSRSFRLPFFTTSWLVDQATAHPPVTPPILTASGQEATLQNKAPTVELLLQTRVRSRWPLTTTPPAMTHIVRTLHTGQSTSTYLHRFFAAQGHESDSDLLYNRQYSASVDSHMSGLSTIQHGPFADIPGSSAPYPAWSSERQIPISMEEIEDIFLDLTYKFGFQKDSMRNMVSRNASPLSLSLSSLIPSSSIS